jgi:hypothetical protein
LGDIDRICINSADINSADINWASLHQPGKLCRYKWSGFKSLVKIRVWIPIPIQLYCKEYLKQKKVRFA